MRQVGQVQEEWQAKRFGDFLVVQNISHEVSNEEDGTFLVWVHKDGEVGAARDWFAEFEQDPQADKFVTAEREAKTARRQKVKAEHQNAKRREKLERRIRPPARSIDTPIVVTGLCAVSVVVAFLGGLGWNGLSQAETISALWFTEKPLGPFMGEILSGEVWRLVTPIFVHYSFLHLFFNLWCLWTFGRSVESLKGPTYLALLVLILAVASNSGQYTLQHIQGYNAGFGGMSGVVYGLFGYVWTKSRFDPFSGFMVAPNTVFILLAWFVLCFTGMLGPIANGAHAVGLVLGASWGFLTARLRRW